MRNIECFKIRLLESDGTHIWDLCHQKPLYDILCDCMPMSFNPVTIVADPFLFVHNGRLFLFYEMKRNYSPGVICMTSTMDLLHWTKAQQVLKEDFHLSYPFVFEEKGSVYMIPETSDIGDIRLYKADDDSLSHFTFYKTLVSKEVFDTEIGYADSSVLINDDGYYLISSIERNRMNYLYLFVSNHLNGPYSEHPCSPICIDSKYGRNGGCLLVDNNGDFFRVAQDCEKRYGDNIHLLKIDKLSRDAYKEHVVRQNLIPTNLSFYSEGGHQFNFVKYRGKYIVATDAKEYHSYFFYRMMHKVGLALGQFFKKCFPF